MQLLLKILSQEWQTVKTLFRSSPVSFFFLCFELLPCMTGNKNCDPAAHSIATDKRVIHIIFFLFLHENICCGYSLEAPRQGASNEYHNICFRGEIRKISTFFG